MKKKNAEKQDVVIAFRKAKSHIETIIRMIEKKEYCVDIMQQNLAVIGLLKSAHEKLMENHLHTCFTKGMKSSDSKKKEAMIGEVRRLMKMVNK